MCLENSQLMVKVLVFITLGFGFTNCLDEVLAPDSDIELLRLVNISTNSLVISWSREGDWTDVDEFNVEILEDSVGDDAYNCSSNVTCSDEICFFNSAEYCDLFDNCMTVDIYVEANSTVSDLCNVTSAPPSPQIVRLDTDDNGVICNWEPLPEEADVGCHTSTIVHIETLAQMYSENLTNIEQTSMAQTLTVCDVGLAQCSVAFQGGTEGMSEFTQGSINYTAKGSLISTITLNTSAESLKASWSLKVECSRLSSYLIELSEEETLINSTQVGLMPQDYRVEDLIPCAEYTVQVQPLDELNSSLAEPRSGKNYTTMKKPNQPEEVTCGEAMTGYEFQVTWQPPLKNHCVEGYAVTYNGTVKWSNKTIQKDFYTKNLEQNLPDLIPWTEYTVCVAGTVAGNLTGEIACCNRTTLQEAPSEPGSFRANNPGPNSVKLSWEAPEEKNGILIGYILTWDDDEKVRNLSADVESVEIEGLYSKTVYNFSIQAQTEGGKFSEKNSVAIETPLNVFVISLSVAGAVIVLVVAMALYVFRDTISQCKDKITQPRSWNRSIRRTTKHSQNGHGMTTQSSRTTTEGDSTTEPIEKEELRQYIADLEEDSLRGLEEEFVLLRTRSGDHPATVSKEYFNKQKNRFVNVYPYDHARVVLPKKNGTAGTDYINASYIKNIKGEDSFIAAQGPKENTMDDFWRMVWKIQAVNIVMLTNLTERGKEKCFKYWPYLGESPFLSGNLSIVNCSEDHGTSHTIRHLEISEGSNEIRNITQYHFTTWPDFGVPQHVDQLLDFINMIRSQMKDSNAPIVVHCSAGIGRTGTFIGVWNLIDSVMNEPSNSKIDIRRTVLNMRECRPMMVQSQDQYLYLCKCIATYIEESERWNMTYTEEKDQTYDNNAYEKDDDDDDDNISL